MAFSISAFVIVMVLSAFQRVSTTEARLLSDTLATEFAAAQLQRYAVTGEASVKSGQYLNRWQWVISERLATDQYWENANLEWRLVELEISVVDRSREYGPVYLKTAVLYPPWRPLR